MQVRLKLCPEKKKKKERNPKNPLMLLEKDMQECNITCSFCF